MHRLRARQCTLVRAARPASCAPGLLSKARCWPPKNACLDLVPTTGYQPQASTMLVGNAPDLAAPAEAVLAGSQRSIRRKLRQASSRRGRQQQARQLCRAEAASQAGFFSSSQPSASNGSAPVTAPWAKPNARLVLQDGSVWHGTSFGAAGVGVAEVVFNTALTGYQEILTDPSYRGQYVVFTHPHIGNTGINPGATPEQPMPRPAMAAFGSILCEPCSDTRHSRALST